ncbi:MAG: SMP-30/gluconolactonase/LRE family protein [Nitrospirota bacterium]|nr:MAG: SMP-30/gluconolactonase/LRE family protein [Nitrospirota bacterium]
MIITGSWVLAHLHESQGSEAGSRPVCQSPSFPRWTFDESHLYPHDRPLARPEDGKALPDGRLVVADETHGLLLLEKDASHRPFGQFNKAGYIHDPPKIEGGAHGVFLEHDGRYLLLSDVYSGKIFRVNAQTEETRLIYDHPFGVNSVYRDREGTIWFTQSAHNTAQGGKESLWASVDLPKPTGAVFKLEASGVGISMEAEEVVSQLYFANGITLDRTEEYMYVAEMTMDRVLRFQIDVKSGTILDRESYQNILMPDNLAIDADNNLWIVSNMGNKVTVVDKNCQSMHTVFHAGSNTHTEVLDEWLKRSHLGQPRGDLLTRGSWNPLPNYLTGLFFSPNYETVYFTGLGNAILKYAMPRQ